MTEACSLILAACMRVTDAGGGIARLRGRGRVGLGYSMRVTDAGGGTLPSYHP